MPIASKPRGTLAEAAPAGWDGAALVPYVEWLANRPDGKGTYVHMKADFAAREISGYASTWDVDLGNDRILPGAFTRSLEERHVDPLKNNGASLVRFLWQHNPDVPLGPVLEMRQDDIGLWVRARISHTSAGNDAYALLKDRAIDRMSIGYATEDKAVARREDGGRDIKETDIWEFSLVTFPMNMAALVVNVKHGDVETKLDFGSPSVKTWVHAPVLDTKHMAPNGDEMVPVSSTITAEGLAETAPELSQPEEGKEMEVDQVPIAAKPTEEKAGKVLSARNAARLKEVFSQFKSAAKTLVEFMADSGVELDLDENPWVRGDGVYDPRPSDDDDTASSGPPPTIKANGDHEGDETCPTCGRKMRTKGMDEGPDEDEEGAEGSDDPKEDKADVQEANTCSSKDIVEILARLATLENSLQEVA